MQRNYINDDKAERLFYKSTPIFMMIEFENHDSRNFRLIPRKIPLGKNPFYKAVVEIKRKLRQEGFIPKDRKFFFKSSNLWTASLK